MVRSRCSFMLDTLLRLVETRYVAIIQTCSPSFDPSMTVPVFGLNRLAHCFSRHRYGIVACFAPVWTFSEPQCGHATPVGHRRATNQASAVASSGNMRKIWTRLMPSRKLFPGALCAMPVSS